MIGPTRSFSYHELHGFVDPQRFILRPRADCCSELTIVSAPELASSKARAWVLHQSIGFRPNLHHFILPMLFWMLDEVLPEDPTLALVSCCLACKFPSSISDFLQFHSQIILY